MPYSIVKQGIGGRCYSTWNGYYRTLMAVLLSNRPWCSYPLFESYACFAYQTENGKCWVMDYRPGKRAVHFMGFRRKDAIALAWRITKSFGCAKDRHTREVTDFSHIILRSGATEESGQRILIGEEILWQRNQQKTIARAF